MNDKENKKDNGFAQGITLIIIGVIFTLISVFDYEINWHVLGKMWPVLLIIIGVCIMPINKWIRTVIAILLLAFGAVIYHQRTEDYGCDTKVRRTNECIVEPRSHGDCDYDD